MMSKKTHKYLEDYMQPFYNFYNQLKPIMYFRYAYFFLLFFKQRIKKHKVQEVEEEAEQWKKRRTYVIANVPVLGWGGEFIGIHHIITTYF